jgi:hypothetical protein
VPGRQGKTWPYEKSTGDSDIEVVEVSSVPLQSSRSSFFFEESANFESSFFVDESRRIWSQLLGPFVVVVVL